MDREVRRRLWECCNQLKSPYREVAIDYYYHEMEIGDIVKKTGKNIKPCRPRSTGPKEC